MKFLCLRRIKLSIILENEKEIGGFRVVEKGLFKKIDMEMPNLKGIQNPFKEKMNTNPLTRENFDGKKVNTPIKPHLLGKLSLILVKIEFIDECYDNYSLGLIDFAKIKNILIKDLNNDKYRRILKKEIYSYYIEKDYLFLKLLDGDVLKIRFN